MAFADCIYGACNNQVIALTTVTDLHGCQNKKLAAGKILISRAWSDKLRCSSFIFFTVQFWKHFIATLLQTLNKFTTFHFITVFPSSEKAFYSRKGC